MADTTSAPRLTVTGEALVDLIPDGSSGGYRARPGGSPFNVAIGLARLGHRTTLMARLADNAFGRLLRAHAEAEHLDLSHAPAATQPTTLAVVSLDRDAQASYDFYLQGTADWQWTDAELARVPGDTAVFHFGSLASWTPPGAERIHAAAARLRRDGRGDGQLRPQHPADAARRTRRRPRPRRALGERRAHRQGQPGGRQLALSATRASPRSARGGRNLARSLVVITDGPDGAAVFLPGEAPARRPGRKVQVADTIGAGDAFTAGLIGGLARRGMTTPSLLRGCPPALAAEAVDEAILISALTCERSGADPPFLAARPTRNPGAPLTAADLVFVD